eukprot:jgi/Botrbrau1/345/Bobra.110_2s0004.1
MTTPYLTTRGKIVPLIAMSVNNSSLARVVITRVYWVSGFHSEISHVISFKGCGCVFRVLRDQPEWSHVGNLYDLKCNVAWSKYILTLQGKFAVYLYTDP